MEYKYCNRNYTIRILLSTLFFAFIPFLFLSQGNFDKPRTSSNFAVRAFGLITGVNSTTCDCNAYCAQVLISQDTEKRYSNSSGNPGLTNYNKGLNASLNINKTGREKSASVVSKQKHAKFSIKQAILQIQKFAKTHHLSKMDPEGNAVKYVFILTTWRSGSSFFGEALSSHPAIFYHYEPLIYLFMEEVRKSGQILENAFQTLGNLSHCEYSKAKTYMNYMQHSWNVLARNPKIQSQCMQLKQKCFDFDFLKASCSIFPVQVFKLTRIRGQVAEEILRRFNNSKIIYLVRDPRATYSSRMKVGWCPAKTPCGNISLLCDDLGKDLLEIRKLQAKQSQNVRVVKYEHLATNPETNFKHIYKFLGLEWHTNVQKYLNEHTHKNSKQPMSTFKDSVKHVDQWTYSLANQTIQKIQRECKDFMINLEYEFVK